MAVADAWNGSPRVARAVPHYVRQADTLVPPKKTEVSVRPAGLKARGILIPQRAAGK